HRPVPQTGSRVQIDEDVRIDEDHRSSPRVMAMNRSLVSLRFHAAPLSRSTIVRPLRRRSARTILTPSFSRKKATSSPTFQPNASLSSLGTVICPFTVMVLVFMAQYYRRYCGGDSSSRRRLFLKSALSGSICRPLLSAAL